MILRLQLQYQRHGLIGWRGRECRSEKWCLVGYVIGSRKLHSMRDGVAKLHQEKDRDMQCIYYNRGSTLHTGNGGVNYKEALQKSKWIQKEAEVLEKVKLLMTTSGLEENELLCRCLVGRHCGGEEASTGNEVRRWAHHTWKGAANI